MGTTGGTARRMLLAALLSMAAGADANAVTGNTLLNHCEAGEGKGLESAIPFGTCLGFSSAVMEAMISNGRRGGRNGRVEGRAGADGGARRGHLGGREACFPEGTAPGEARDAAKRFLGAHPDRLGEAAADLVAEALAGAFPCEQAVFPR